jgi:hypothetical protein
VTVTVINGAATNIPPVTEAGDDMMTSTSTATLNGSNSYDPDGTINSYQWTKISGPAIFTISNANVATPALSFLMLGDYAFELQSNRQCRGSTRDTVYIRSSAVSLPVQWLYFNARNSGSEIKFSGQRKVNIRILYSK